jgi:hypothetical protein
MKIQQNARHFASRKALELPVVRALARRGLVSLHTRVFLGYAEEGRREERHDHLEALFDGTMDAYLAALQAGYSEAEAREMTHVQANFDFYNHGWTEMMEFPTTEVEDHYDRYADFFERHGVTIDDPLGRFGDGEMPPAPATLDRLDDPDHPHAEGGFADDVYVADDDGEVRVGDRGDIDADDVDVTEAPGVEGES